MRAALSPTTTDDDPCGPATRARQRRSTLVALQHELANAAAAADTADAADAAAAAQPLAPHGATVAREPLASATSESKPGTALLLVAAILALLSISRLASRLPCFRAGPCVQATCRCAAPTRSEFSKIGVLQE